MSNTRNLQTKVFAMRTPLSVVCLQVALVGGTLAGAPSSNGSSRLSELNESDPPSLLVPSGWKASWDPEGKHLVYGLGLIQGVLVLDLETMNVTRLSNRGKDPAWSPDGRNIAFVQEPGPNAYADEIVWVMDADGKNARPIARGGFPSWSADSLQVYLHSRRNNHILAVNAEDPDQMEVIYTGARSFYFAVSPDAKRIAFGSREKVEIVDVARREVLLSWPTAGERGTLPGWSPDGRFVAFGGFDDSTVGLRLLDVEKHRAVTLVQGPATMPTWSSDGRWMAFDIRSKGRSVWVVGHDWLLKRLNDEVPVHSIMQ
jgi:Tol biopolymer transport system component